MKAVVAAFNQEKALVGAFSVITNLLMELFEALVIMAKMESMRRQYTMEKPRDRLFRDSRVLAVKLKIIGKCRYV